MEDVKELLRCQPRVLLLAPVQEQAFRDVGNSSGKTRAKNGEDEAFTAESDILTGCGIPDLEDYPDFHTALGIPGALENLFVRFEPVRAPPSPFHRNHQAPLIQLSPILAFENKTEWSCFAFRGPWLNLGYIAPPARILDTGGALCSKAAYRAGGFARGL